jgi:NTP pyrophosphatase (non-canonical NTP hydrolase)
MTDTEYSLFVEQLFKTRHEGIDGLLHATIGISTEAGEILDAVKKTFAYNAVLDRENVIEELGDLEFFCCALRRLLNLTREQVIAANVEKLSKRYPGVVYSDHHAQVRLDKQ